MPEFRVKSRLYKGKFYNMPQLSGFKEPCAVIPDAGI
jgi:hypothetical protein